MPQLNVSATTSGLFSTGVRARQGSVPRIADVPAWKAEALHQDRPCGGQRFRYGLAVGAQYVEMECDSFLDERLGLVPRVSGGDTAGKVWNVRRVAVARLFDDRSGLARRPQARPDHGEQRVESGIATRAADPRPPRAGPTLPPSPPGVACPTPSTQKQQARSRDRIC